MDSCLRNSEQAVLSFYPSFQKYLLSSVFRYLLLLHTFLRSPKGQQKTRLPVLFQTKKTYADLLIDDQWIYDMFCDTHSDDDIIIHRTDLGFQCIFDREKVFLMEYVFHSATDYKSVISKYGHGISEIISIRIGSDARIYILLEHSHNDEKNTNLYTAIVMDVDWDTGVITSDRCCELGELISNFYKLQNCGDQLLIVGTRCTYRGENTTKNAMFFDMNGHLTHAFCMGDGISRVVARKDHTILASYFDEGIFGNLGWDDPIGSPGVIIWSDQGQKIWESDRDIIDCYAANVDDDGNAWYYYYDEFLLVKNVSGVETEYDPGIEGAHFFLFTEDGHVIMNGGYDAGSFLYVLTLEPSPSKEELKLYCGEEKPIFTSMTSYASYGLFFDNKNRMFLTRFTRMS